MAPEELHRHPDAAKFLQYCLDNAADSPSTIRTYQQALTKWIDWCDGSSITDIRDADKQDFTMYRDYLIGNGFKLKSVQLFMTVVKRFYSWMEFEDMIEFSKYPKMLTIKGDNAKPTLVPTPDQIFKVRRKCRGITLREAMAFEVLLSTGMRVSEFLQIRACDVDFGDHPHDKEFDAPSPFFCGSISIDRDIHVTKGDNTRKVYLSNIAAKLLKANMDKEGIKEGGMVPIFMWSKPSLEKWLQKMGRGVFGKVSDDTPERTVGLRDLTEKDLEGLDPKLKRKVMRRQKTEANMPQHEQKGRKRNGKKSRKLHAHALRHSFTCIMFYRNYFGERQSEDRLRVLLGHSKFTTTFLYLKKIDMLHDDDTWRRLVFGRSYDWPGVH